MFFYKVCVLPFVLVGLLMSNRAQALVDVPTMNRPLIDGGQFIPDAQENAIEQRIRSLYTSGGPQLVVWTMPSLDGEDIAQLGIRAAEAWKIGREKQDDGIILLVSRAERRTRLEVGYGLEGTIPDIAANRLLQSVIRPTLRENNLGVGIISLVESLDKLTHDPETRKQMSAETGNTNDLLSHWKSIAFVIILMIIISALDRMRPNNLQRRRQGSGIWWSSGGGGWGGGSSGGGGSSWSGGGGSFGGGGSSGDW